MIDQETFTAQVLLHQQTLFRTARSILSNDADAEDAVQEAICSGFAHRHTLREADKFKPWMLRIVTNQCYTVLRRTRPVAELEPLEQVLAAPEHDREAELTLWQAVLSLREEQRVVVTLFYYEDYSVREISRILSVSEGAVKSRLSRGREQLRSLLKDTWR